MRSLRARATIIAMRVLPRPSAVRCRYHFASALSFWNTRKRQASWTMPRRTRALPARESPRSRRRAPLSSRRSGQAGVARDGSPVTQVRTADLMDEHISRLDPDHRRPVPARAPWRAARFVQAACSNRVSPLPLDLPDLADDKPSRAMSRRSSAKRVGRQRHALGVCAVARRSAALRRAGLKLRMPSRARVDFMRLTIRVRSPTRFSRSRFGRLASSSVNRRHARHAAMAPFATQPPQEPALQNSVSSRSVFARRCSRDTATL